MALEDKVPFDPYDFFAYLTSGAILLVAAGGDDLATQVGLEPGLARGAVGIVASYVLGHTVSQVASSALERLLVNRLLRHPIRTLLDSRPPGVWRWMFWEFAKPLPPHQREEIDNTLKERRLANERGEALTTLATQNGMRGPVSGPRMATFLRLYAFARNASVSCAIAAAMFWLSGQPVHWQLIIALLAVGYILLLRYLKFYRLYFREALLSLIPDPHASDIRR